MSNNKIELENLKNENDNIYTILRKIPNSNRFLKKVSLDLDNSNSINSLTFYRTDLKSILNSSLTEINAKYYGVYFLINEQDNSIYVGKTKDIENRMKNHDRNKNFDRIILLIKKNWTTTIIDYLEWWFINFFMNNQNEFKLENKREESEPNYTPYDKKEINKALETSFWLLLNEGINISNNNDKDVKLKDNYSFINSDNENKYENIDNNENSEVYYKNTKAFYCFNNISSKKILLLKGTTIIWNKFESKDFKESTHNNIKRYNNFFEDSLKNNRISLFNNNQYILNEDIYLSPSFAASLVDGYFAKNGNSCWRFANNKFIKE